MLHSDDISLAVYFVSVSGLHLKVLDCYSCSCLQTPRSGTTVYCQRLNDCEPLNII